MPSEWINHVKQYAKTNDISYKKAMSQAKSTYKPKHGGDLKSTMRKAQNTLKTVARKTRNSANAGSKFIDKNQNFISYLDPNLGRNLNDANAAYKSEGGKFNMENFIRKAENTGKRAKVIGRKTKNTVSKVLDYAAPIAMEFNPALGTAFMGANTAMNMGGKLGKLGKNKNPYLIGGSFKTQGGSFKVQGSGMCPTCGSHKLSGGNIQLGRSNSSILASTHNSFAPLKPKPFLER